MKDWDEGIERMLEAIARRPGVRELHEELRRMALGRKIAGGKPMSMAEEVAGRVGVVTPLEVFIVATRRSAKDPGNVGCLVEMLEGARELGLEEVAGWLEGLLRAATKGRK